LALAKHDWLKAKKFQQCFCLTRQNRRSLLAFTTFNKEASIWYQKEKHWWSYFAIRRIRLLGLSWVYLAKVQNFKDEKETITIEKTRGHRKKTQSYRVVAPWLVD